MAESTDRTELRRPLRKAFIDDLYRVLEQKQISQRQLRDDLAWGSHTTINRWRNLIAEPEPDEVFDLERYLDIPPGSLSQHLGYVPPIEGRTLPVGIEATIAEDPILPDWGKTILTVAYQQIMVSLGRGRRR